VAFISSIVHSDHDSLYASDAYRALPAQHYFVASTSRKGNCWDNAVMARFFLNPKVERVWHISYANHAEATRDMTDYIVGRLQPRPPSRQTRLPAAEFLRNPNGSQTTYRGVRNSLTTPLHFAHFVRNEWVQPSTSIVESPRPTHWLRSVAWVPLRACE